MSTVATPANSRSSIPEGFQLDPSVLSSLKQETISLKFCIIGAGTVGKTTLTRRFADAEFIEPTKSTQNVDIARKTVQVGGKVVRVEMWDVAGQQNYRVATNNFFRHCHVILLVASLAEYDAASWAEAVEWIQHARSLEPFFPDSTPEQNMPIPVILVASKSDISVHSKTPQQIEDFARSLGATHWCMTSGKESINVTEVFRAGVIVGMSHMAKVRQRAAGAAAAAAPIAKTQLKPEKKNCPC